MSLAEQLEHADALAEVVIRLGRASGHAIETAAQAEEFAPGATHGGRADSPADGVQTSLGFLYEIRGEESLDGDELGLEHVSRRRIDGLGDIGGKGYGRPGLGAAQRDARLQHEQRPLIPAGGLGSILAVGVARLRQTPVSLFMLASYHVDLRQRIEDRASRLAHELQGAPHVEGAIERLFGAVQVAEPDTDLAERGERDAEPVRRAAVLLQLDAAFRQRQRLLVPMLHQRDVGLVATDRRQHVPRLDEHGQPLSLRERRHRLFEASLLRESHAGERVHHRQVPPVADGMEGRRRLRQMLADDARVADLPVAEAQLEMRQTNRPRIVGTLGGLERFGQEGDATRRFAARGGQSAMHSPEV